jgi:uncharacterized protein YndB with AHSA1/START domain
MDTIELSAEFAVSPKRVYEAWLDSNQHSAMTGATASVEPWVGGQHTAWDGYSWGRILELEPDRRIVQSYRTSEFPLGSEDSRLEIRLEPTAIGARMTLRHSQIPAGQGPMYRDGWEENYFRPMRAYFRAAMPAMAPEPMMAPAAPAKPAAVSAPKKAAKKVARKATPRKKVARKAGARKKVARKVRAAKKRGTRRVKKTRAKVAKRARRARKTRTRVAKRARKTRKSAARKTRRKTSRR